MSHTAGSPVGEPYLALVQSGLSGCRIQPAHWPIGGWRGGVKRTIDIVFALLTLVILSIPMVLVAAAIRLDSPGPILFRQRRVGFANVGFEIWKFRTMHCDASEPGRLMQATRHDKRVTRVGAWLRRSSLDEVPQLLNVLRGDMSLVGPRPHAPGTCAGGKPFELITPHYMARHRVKPGLTGLAQIRGWRGETESEEKLLRRLDADLEYIGNWSLWLDVVILARTCVPAAAMRNAY